MKMKIINETENALFNRKEILAEVESEAVPSNAEVKKILSEKFSVPEDAVKINRIGSKFGSKTFSIEANIYSSKEDLDAVEVKTKKQKDAEKKAAEEKLKSENEKSAEESVQEKNEELKEEVNEEKKDE